MSRASDRRSSDWLKCHVSLGATDYHDRLLDLDALLDLRDWILSLDPHRSRLAVRVLGGCTPNEREKGDALMLAKRIEEVITP